MTLKLGTDKKYLKDTDFSYRPGVWVIDKGKCGCGGTTLALEDEKNWIICSPRRALGHNKYEQYEGRPEGRYKLVDGECPEGELVVWLMEQGITDTDTGQRPFKILTTYDSLPKVARALRQAGADIEGLWSDWYVLVDEFQLLLLDSGFKSDVEMRFLDSLCAFPNVTYLSATPIKRETLLGLNDTFNAASYVTLKWAGETKARVSLQKCNKPLAMAVDVITTFKERKRLEDKALSRQDKRLLPENIVMFLNSVQAIGNIIKKSLLLPEEVNIVCSDNEENRDFMVQLSAKCQCGDEAFSIGKIPLRGERHKTFTFCTSTAWSGVDFYNESALAFVVCDCHRKNTCVDIELELPQIAGRLRLKENPYKDELVMIYNTGEKEQSQEAFEAVIKGKDELTAFLLDRIGKAVSQEERKANISAVKKDQDALKFTTHYAMYDADTGTCRVNKLARVHDIYQYELRNMTYTDDRVIKTQLDETSDFHITEWVNNYYSGAAFMEEIKKVRTFPQKMRAYCELRDALPELTFMEKTLSEMKLSTMTHELPELKTYYESLGTRRIETLKYNEHKLLSEYAEKSAMTRAYDVVRKQFKDGERLSRADIKERLTAIYQKCGVKRKARATDLKTFGYDVHPVKLPRGEKRLDGFEMRRRNV